jgi:methyl-accepting chemotaxis protein
MAQLPGRSAAGRRAGIGGWLANRPMAVKFLLVIAATAVVAVTVAVTAMNGMAAMRGNTDHLYSNNLSSLKELDRMRDGALNMRIDVLNAGVSVDPATAEKFLSKVAGDDAVFDDALTKYESAHPAGGNPDLATLRQGMTTYRQVRDTKLIPAVRKHDPTTFGQVRDKEGAPAFAKVNTALTDLTQHESDDARAARDGAGKTASSAQLTLIIVLVVGLLVALALGLFQSRVVAGAVRRVGSLAEALGRGDLTRTAEVNSRDEIGRMAAALDGATARLRESVGVVATSSQSLAAAAEELSGASQQIATSADETNAQASTVSAAAEEVSRSVQTVAAGTEEMSASIREIASNASDAAQVANEAVGIVESVNATVGQLGASSMEIGNVISLITSIAEQTNLLALNATIEAARAGDAGKGFAVVASEVKDLAQETAKATGDISTRVQAIQTDAEAAVEAIGKIVDVIEKINNYSTMIASAVEEQTSTTSEISRNITEAATGSSQIAENITGVATASDLTTEGVNESRRTADEVARMAGELQRVVGQFQV